MQMQLDLAINSLKRHNLPIPSDIKIETAKDLNLDEEDDKQLDVSKLPELNQSVAPANGENSVME